MKQFGKEIQNLRGNNIGMVFQEPNSSLSMVHTVGDQIEEGLKTHTSMNSKLEFIRSVLPDIRDLEIPDKQEWKKKTWKRTW